MATIGLLPASGKASRIAGIPKFCVPISGTQTLLHWHVERLRAVCDEVRVCTQPMWVPFVNSLRLPITLYVKEPTTMSDAVVHMAAGADHLIVGMPDTMFVNTTINPYKAIAGGADVMLAAFHCREALRGHVGQILLDGQRVMRAEDKQSGCSYEHMWGAMFLHRRVWPTLKPELAHPGLQLQSWIDSKKLVRAVVCDGEYVDVGRIEGLFSLYRHLVNGY